MAGLLPQPPLQTYGVGSKDMFTFYLHVWNPLRKTTKDLHNYHVLAFMGLPNNLLLAEVKSLIKVIKPGSKG